MKKTNTGAHPEDRIHPRRRNPVAGLDPEHHARWLREGIREVFRDRLQAPVRHRIKFALLFSPYVRCLYFWTIFTSEHSLGVIDLIVCIVRSHDCSTNFMKTPCSRKIRLSLVSASRHTKSTALRLVILVWFVLTVSGDLPDQPFTLQLETSL